ncbi:acyltransferase [Pandoraea captiosa]|uniref:Acyltransferase n=1 Tax=Pandoraea captiosa TaxID=2508302 RepID=A0A5E5AL06_9BURK|nr:acyltransferase [Pandoraea captiosa]VVE73472.1 acyltransferase [Pandoraea captiosa]
MSSTGSTGSTGNIGNTGNTDSTRGRMVGIEILRFFSAFAVLVWHYQHFFFRPETASIEVVRDTQPLYALLHPFYDFGWLGVNVFWTISGFIFFNRYLSKIVARQVSGGLFFLNRFSRLYPLHIVTLVVVALLQTYYVRENHAFFVYPYNTPYDFFVNVIFASGWLTPYTDSFNGPVWSVSTEIVIYVAFFLLARCCRIGLGWTLLIMCLSAATGGLLIHQHIKGSESNIVFCAFYFFMGGAVHLVYERLRDVIEAHRRATVLLCCAGYAVLFAACALFGGTKYLAATVIAPVSIVLLHAIEPWIPERFASPIANLGNTTYSSYLIHFPLQLTTVIVLQRMGMSSATLAMSPWFLAAYLIVVFVLARWVYRALEAPAQTFLRRRLAWLGGRSRRGAAN